MNQLQKPDEFGLMPINQSSSLMEVISRAASDPATDVSKLERLMEMAERIQVREARMAYYGALAEMQIKLPVIQERGSIKIGSGDPQKYALWEDINRQIKPILSEHGFALSFRTGIAEAKITVTGILSHSSGHAEETTIHLPADTSGSKNAVQAVGSSTSYGKRYTASALLNLTSSGEDDDGHAGAGDLVSLDQIEKITDLLNATNSDVEAFCAFMHVPSIKDIRQVHFDKAIVALNMKSRKAKAK